MLLFSAFTHMTEQIRHLVRIANTDLDGLKPVHQSLLKIKGVGVSFSNLVVSLAHIDKNVKMGSLNEEEIVLLDKIIRAPLQNGAPSWMVNRRRDIETNEDKHLIVADLEYAKENDIKRLRKIKTYRGDRHSKGLPTRGQRTRSNFRKNKGKVTLGVQRKKVVAEAAAADKTEKKTEKKKEKK